MASVRKGARFPMKKPVKVLLFFLCAIFAGVFAFSGYKLYTIMHGYHAAEQTYSNLSDQYVAPVPSSTPFDADAGALPHPGRF